MDLHHLTPQIGAPGEAMRVGLEPDPAADHAARAGVERSGPKHGAHPAFAIVEIGLQQRGALPRIHAGIIEIELGHGATASAALSFTRVRKASIFRQFSG